ncbi:MAG: tetratricopeptide repeat protein, partial [Opitutae bacterium]|nr:tetratricopeptide repeat protein [Opitutae bacterium]
ATPDHLHSTILHAAIRAGKDAYCEKPLARTMRELNRVVDAVRASDRVVQMGTGDPATIQTLGKARGNAGMWLGRVIIWGQLALWAVLAGLLRMDVFGIREETFGFARLSAAQDLLALGKPEAAIAELERLQAGGRLNAPEVAITLVQAHLARGGPGVTAAVRTVAEEALTRHPDTPELLWAAAVAHQQDRNWPKVRERVERLLQVDPENIQALHLAGLAALRQGRHHDAEALYQRAVQVDPYHPATQDMGRKLARPQ